MKPELSIIVPVYNEHDALPQLDAEIRSVLWMMDRPAEIIYVDDNSRDGSRDILAELVGNAADSPFRTRVILFRRNFGQTAAMSAGFDAAEGDVIFPLDADGQNNPADIPRLLQEMEEKQLDVVSGWRKKRKDKTLRKIPSRVANRLIGRISGVYLHDYGCTLKAYNATILKEVDLYGEMHRFIPLYMSMLGAKVGELEVDHRPRTTGVSKYGSRRIFKVFLDLFLIRFMTRYYNRPMHFFGQMAVLFMLAMGATFSLMIVFKLGWLRMIGIDYQSSFVQTPLPALAGTFFLGAICSLFFGILAEVLIRVHYDSRHVKPYIVKSTLDSQETQPPHRLKKVA
jgi:glycosyltransferase involved in cell wall biosynthesis